MIKKEAMELAGRLSDFFNTFGVEERAEALTSALMAQHRTLQQSFVRFLIHFIKQYSATATYDKRNEAAVLAMRHLSEYIEASSDDYRLPMI